MRKAMIFAVAALAILMPWIARNMITLHAFIPFSTGGGAVLWGANNPVVFSRWGYGWINPEKLPGWESVKNLGDTGTDKAMTAYALKYLISVPFPVLLRAELAKLAHFFGYGDSIEDNAPILLLAVVILRRVTQ